MPFGGFRFLSPLAPPPSFLLIVICWYRYDLLLSSKQVYISIKALAVSISSNKSESFL